MGRSRDQNRWPGSPESFSQDYQSLQDSRPIFLFCSPNYIYSFGSKALGASMCKIPRQELLLVHTRVHRSPPPTPLPHTLLLEALTVQSCLRQVCPGISQERIWQGCWLHAEAWLQNCPPSAQVLRFSHPTAGPTQEMSSSQLFAGKTQRYTATSGTPAAWETRSTSVGRNATRTTARQLRAGEQLCGVG